MISFSSSVMKNDNFSKFIQMKHDHISLVNYIKRNSKISIIRFLPKAKMVKRFSIPNVKEYDVITCGGLLQLWWGSHDPVK